ncbi:N-acyl-D-amino-acid deacylase family protein [Horticoccus sp. 23ND18S-11]|uniref:N-acyl-D-amino-acid deacylase family protein n=1 Tax=Horticoccus sp. 23ND18S-11 TaxID=3391832 RepID=UPI0039C922F0
MHRSLLPFLTVAVLTFLSACTGPAPSSRAPEYDVVIRHGRVVDGTGAPAMNGDVAIQAGKIVAVGKVAGAGRTEIDARGQVVAPGFIDVHTHSEDVAELPVGENFIRMGVTTIVTGNCGGSKLNVGEFFSSITKTGVALNVATLIGHNTVRGQVMGGSFARPPTDAELEKMRGLVDQAMKDGAVGLSTGLIYLPGTFAKTEEIVALAKVASSHGGIYASHMRSESTGIFNALDELTTIAREAKIPAEVSHLKLSGPAAWGRADEVIAYLDKARAEGLRVTHDQYAYTASSTGIGTLIDADFREGGAKRFRERLADPATKAKMVAEMKGSIAKGKRGDYTYAVVASFKADKRLNGKTIPQAAKILRGADTLDDQIETILEIESRGGAQGVFHGMSEPDLVKFLAQPYTMVASDSGIRRFGEAVPHPRGYGNNARVLARYVREQKVISLEDAVRKMSSLPARTFHLKNRGELKPGFVADVVIFDPEKVSDPSTFNDPHHYAVGFSDVIVNGVPVIRAGQLTDARPGRPVKLQD